jgi:hypothetical protein
MSRKSPHTGRWLLASSVVLALIVSPFALASGEGNPLKGGKRNPSSNASQSFSSETQIIASNDTYGTRQSNKGTGGGAIYGCRSTPGNEACINATNLNKGHAFEFSTAGAEGGVIGAAGGDAAKPFTTNATGVATGLNADRVDSKSASDIAADGAKAAVATAQANLHIANVDAGGALVTTTSRGVTSATSGTAGDGTYTVVFPDDISKCALSAVETQFENAGAVGIALSADNKTVTVRTRAGGGPTGNDSTDPADRPFQLTANCS